MGSWRCSCFIALSKSQGSRQIFSSQFDFSTITRLFTQSVGFSIRSIMSKSTICLGSFSNFGLSPCEMIRAGVTAGWTLSFTSIWLPQSVIVMKFWEKRFIICFISTNVFWFLGNSNKWNFKELFSVITGIMELLYTDNLTFTGWRSGLGGIFSKLSTGIHYIEQQYLVYRILEYH